MKAKIISLEDGKELYAQEVDRTSEQRAEKASNIVSKGMEFLTRVTRLLAYMPNGQWDPTSALYRSNISDDLNFKYKKYIIITDQKQEGGSLSSIIPVEKKEKFNAFIGIHDEKEDKENGKLDLVTDRFLESVEKSKLSFKVELTSQDQTKSCYLVFNQGNLSEISGDYHEILDKKSYKSIDGMIEKGEVSYKSHSTQSPSHEEDDEERSQTSSNKPIPVDPKSSIEDYKEHLAETHGSESVECKEFEQAVKNYFLDLNKEDEEKRRQYHPQLAVILEKIEEQSFNCTKEQPLPSGDAYKGIGCEMEFKPGEYPVIQEVFPGCPAERVGLEAGDKITHYKDGDEWKETTGMDSDQLTSILRQGVEMKVDRDGGSIDIARPKPDFINHVTKRLYKDGLKMDSQEIAQGQSQGQNQTHRPRIRLSDAKLPRWPDQGLRPRPRIFNAQLGK